MQQSVVFRAIALAIGAGVVACSSRPPAPAAGSGDAAFVTLSSEVLEDTYRRQPTQATYLGIHKYDDSIEDYSQAGVAATVEAARNLRARVEAVDPATLSLDKQLDREQLLHALDSRIIQLAVVRPWAKDPDSYSSGITNTAYIMV